MVAVLLLLVVVVVGVLGGDGDILLVVVDGCGWCACGDILQSVGVEWTVVMDGGG